MNNIILIGGATGVGTSRLSLELTKTLDIPAILSTDSIREVIRNTVQQGINSALELSTYEAGQTENYAEKTVEVRKSEILRGYKTQCAAVNIGVEGIIQRATQENSSLIVEGVHLLPGKINQTQRTIEYFMYIKDPELHKKRFIQREEESPQRTTKKYLRNFQEIRWIHDYLFERAKRNPYICTVNNSGTERESLDFMLRFYFSKSE